MTEQNEPAEILLEINGIALTRVGSTPRGEVYEIPRDRLPDIPLGDLGEWQVRMLEEGRRQNVTIEISDDLVTGSVPVRIVPPCACDFPEIGHALTCPHHV